MSSNQTSSSTRRGRDRGIATPLLGLVVAAALGGGLAVLSVVGASGVLPGDGSTPASEKLVTYDH